MRERRVERKGAKAASFLCLTVPQVGFVWRKVIYTYKSNEHRLHALMQLFPGNPQLTPYLLMFMAGKASPTGEERAFLLKLKIGPVL